MNINPIRTTTIPVDLGHSDGTKSLRHRVRSVQFFRRKRTFRAIPALLAAIAIALGLWALIYAIGDIFL